MVTSSTKRHSHPLWCYLECHHPLPLSLSFPSDCWHHFQTRLLDRYLSHRRQYHSCWHDLLRKCRIWPYVFVSLLMLKQHHLLHRPFRIGMWLYLKKVTTKRFVNTYHSIHSCNSTIGRCFAFLNVLNTTSILLEVLMPNRARIFGGVGLLTKHIELFICSPQLHSCFLAVCGRCHLMQLLALLGILVIHTR